MTKISKREFDSLLELKIQKMVLLIITIKHLDFIDAIDYLYNSKIYESLHTESSKIWHLSAEKLVDMLIAEVDTNILTYPDFV